MKHRLYSLAFALAAAVSAPASAMYVNPQGSGQVLLFPYFSVNNGQSTLMTLVNTTDRAKYLQIEFREGYNGRRVLDFGLALAPRDTWTSTVFGRDTQGAARIMTRDRSCTSPDKSGWESQYPGGGYQQPFLPFAYTGGHEDTGPLGDTRMREGYFVVIELAELGGALAAATTGSPSPNCFPFQIINPSSPDLRPPGGGIAGSFALVRAADGTLIAGNATAIEDFSQHVLLPDDAVLPEYLGRGNSRTGEVDAILPVGRGQNRLTYSTLGAPSRAKDALSALLMSDSVYGAMSRSLAPGSYTEWVLTAPTKYLYTDNEVLGVPLGSVTGAEPPFEAVFGGRHPGGSCSRYAAQGYDHEGRAFSFMTDPEFSAPPPGQHPQHALCYATNVVHFSDKTADGTTPLLGSRLGSKLWNPSPAAETATVRIDFGGRPGPTRAYNVLPAGISGPTLRGLPLLGFEATRYISANVPPGYLASYTVASPLRSKTVCSTAAGVPMACP
ncbi:MAG: hypothetical protein JNN30_04275 [Rhodanobacteraceae bacterium]|nr:hypothetical protein [Rhodanobacteraceae bacterium]